MSFIKHLFSKLLASMVFIWRRNVFKNEAKAQKQEKSWKRESVGLYHFSSPSKYLFQWSRLFQATVSQSGTYMLKKRFHNRDCGINKVEGGCRIDDVGNLVLSHDCCYFDGGSSEPAQKLADLITVIVLGFDPMDPIESIVKSASNHVGCDVTKLKDAVLNPHGGVRGGGILSGDALADFFRWNPFDKPPRDRAYERWVLVDFLKKKTNEEMDQKYKDLELGEELLVKLQEKFRSQECWFSPMCCSPSRNDKGQLSFWINTGRQTNIDGWRTLEDIQKFLKPSVKIVDKARY